MNQLRREKDDALHMEYDAQPAGDAVLAADVVVALDAVMAANTVHDALRGRDRLPGRPTANQLQGMQQPADEAVPAATTSHVAERGRGADCRSNTNLISQGFLWPLFPPIPPQGQVRTVF